MILNCLVSEVSAPKYEPTALSPVPTTTSFNFFTDTVSLLFQIPVSVFLFHSQKTDKDGYNLCKCFFQNISNQQNKTGTMVSACLVAIVYRTRMSYCEAHIQTHAVFFLPHTCIFSDYSQV